MRFVGREAFQLIEELELQQFFVRVLFYFRLLPRNFRFVHFAFGFRGEVGAGAHREGARERACEAGGEHHFTPAGISGHARDDAEDRAEAVVHAVDRVADPAGAANVPAFAAQNGLERRSRRWQGATGECPEHDGMVALFEHRFFGDAAIGRIAETRQQLVVFLLGGVLLLLEPVEHDRGIGDPLKPRQAAFHFIRVRRMAGCRRDALGPAGGMPVLLIGQPQQDFFASVILFAVCQVAIGRAGFDFAPPHFLDRRQVDLVDGHETNLSIERSVIRY